MAEVSVREQKIFDIAAIEWDMFQHVYNTGGRADCQDNPDTFFKMRMSQWLVYSDELLDSYYADCKTALENGNNFFFEKYGRMMETTFPDEYNRIKEHLPKESTEKCAKVEKIVDIHVKWDADMAEKYPNIRKRGRVATTSQDNAFAGSSMESYLRSELLTYSDHTLDLLLAETQAAEEKGANLLQEIIANETRFYGYESLDAAEKKHGEIPEI